MVCFSDKLKSKCAMFLMVIGVLLLILGIVICTYGYMTLAGDSDMFADNDYVPVDMGSIG